MSYSRKSFYFSILIASFNLFVISAHAAEQRSYSEDAAFSLQVENDFFGEGSDRHFTNGLRIAYVFPSTKTPGLAKWLRRKLPHLANEADMRVTVAAGQNMYTPDDISATAVVLDDRPYAGWLYGELGLLITKKARRRDTFLLSLGVVGPWSLAKETQIWFHRLINSDRPEGWANQLRNEPALLLLHEREWLRKTAIGNSGLEIDVSPRVGGAVGNVFIYSSAGAMLRLGPHLPKDFGAPRIRPSLSGSAFFDYRRNRIDWYLFGGFEGRFVIRNIFLDGNTYRNSHSIEKERLVADLQAGAAMTFGLFRHPVRVSYNFVFRTKEYEGQPQPDKFGSISVSTRF